MIHITSICSLMIALQTHPTTMTMTQSHAILPVQPKLAAARHVAVTKHIVFGGVIIYKDGKSGSLRKRFNKIVGSASAVLANGRSVSFEGSHTSNRHGMTNRRCGRGARRESPVTLILRGQTSMKM